MALAEKRVDVEKAPHAFKTISEVSEELDVPAHVLRFWEQKFPHIQPMKRRGGRRYYRPEDVAALRAVQKLLYEEGYTIKGAAKLFGTKKPANEEKAAEPADEVARELSALHIQARKADKTQLRALLTSLKQARELLKDAA